MFKVLTFAVIFVAVETVAEKTICAYYENKKFRIRSEAETLTAEDICNNTRNLCRLSQNRTEKVWEITVPMNCGKNTARIP